LPDSQRERVIGGKYRLMRLLGSGGMGRVFVAEHLQMRRSFALKFLRPDRSSTPRYLRRFEREAELLGRLEHENVVSLHDIGVDAAGGPYLVLEYVRGITLREELEQHGVRPVERLLPIVRQVARGLAHAHALGIVHRDLKPENVMLAEHADGTLLVKLLDFGVAGLRDDDAERLTLSDTAIGTAAYMAPEQARGDRTLDPRTDVFALGVITYEALSGVRPYAGSSYNETLFKILHRKHRSLLELRPELPAALVAAVERALEKDAEARFPSVEEFVREIEGGVPGLSRSPLPATPLESTLEGPALPALGAPMKQRRGSFVAALGLGVALGYVLAPLPAGKSSDDGAAPASDPAEPPVARRAASAASGMPDAPRAEPAPTVALAAPKESAPATPPPRPSSPAAAARSAPRPAPARGAGPAPAATSQSATRDPPKPDERGYIMFNPYPSLVGTAQRP
jgi:serine/threonine-protein kinase